ncbi:MAG: hypothetical protein QXX57_06090, partial [Nitrososphaerota archaeon]
VERSPAMLGHLSSRHGEDAVCRVCGRESSAGEPFQYITGFGYVCQGCGLQPVVCDSCATKVRRLTITVLRGRGLCLKCYREERERGEKRMVREVGASNPAEAMKVALETCPEGFTLVGLRLRTSSKATWQAEYERDDIFGMRCS